MRVIDRTYIPGNAFAAFDLTHDAVSFHSHIVEALSSWMSRPKSDVGMIQQSTSIGQ